MSSAVDKRAYFAQIGHNPHPKQRLFHDSKARFKIAVCGRRFGKSLMAARDLEPELLLPKRRYWLVGPCVDEETEILTEHGWLSYDQLQIDDSVLTLNHQGLAEWQPCLDVQTFTGLHSMTRIQQRGHDSFTTPHHRWLVGYTGSIPGGGRKDLGFRFTTTHEMTKPNEYILGGAPVINLPQEPKYQDAFVELVGWYWTEGTNQAQGEGVLITQNAGPNADRIRVAATAIFGPPSTSTQMRNSYDPTPRWSDWKPIPGMATCGRFGFNSRAGKLLRQVAPDKVVSPNFIMALTPSQLLLLLTTSVAADGHERVRKKSSGASCIERIIVQDRRDRLSSMQMVAQLAGFQTTLLYDVGGERWRLSIFERSRMWLGQKAAVEKRERVDDYEGTVWCPRTQNGTWLARRNGTVYFTGNTYDLAEKEFRVIWDDMVIGLGFGQEKGMRKSFNLRTGDMYIEFPWGSRVEAKTAHINPEKSLVGEALDGLILCEAAKHNANTWNRFLRPALSDKRGWATMSTTPEGYNWLYDEWKHGKDRLFPDYASWRFPSWENNVIYPGGYDDPEIQLLKQTLSQEEFDQEIAALFTASVGRIYGEFDEETHTLPNYEFNPAWPNYMGIDWGFSHPLAAIEFQVSPSDEVYVWREYYRQYQMLEACFDEMNAREQPRGYHLDYVFGDAEDPEAALRCNQKFAPCLAEPEAKKNWRQGIDLVKKFLKPQQVGFDEFERPVKRPHLFVTDCPTLTREFANYKKKDSKHDIKETTSTGTVLKKDDNGLDALRYGMMHIFELGAQEHLADVLEANPLLRDSMDSQYPALTDAGFFTYDGMDW